MYSFVHLLIQNEEKRRSKQYRWSLAIGLLAIICIGSSFVFYASNYLNHPLSYDTIKGAPITRDAIALLPSFGFRVEWLPVGAVLVYLAGLHWLSLSRHIHWYFLPLALLAFFQLLRSSWVLMDREEYVKAQLSDTWERAFSQESNSSSVLYLLQKQWKCQGYRTPEDRPAPGTHFTQPCFSYLVASFGTDIYSWGMKLWAINVVQVIGLLICYSFYFKLERTGEPVRDLESPDVQEKSIKYDQDVPHGYSVIPTQSTSQTNHQAI
ncbi:hypothetical protein CLU79DRAFT_765169, partial [Phycomyces nitens]